MKLISCCSAASLVLVLATGCSSADGWEQEYACAGREQSSAYFAGSEPTLAMHQDYPLSIDFHLRSGTAMVKSSLVKVESTSPDAVRFSSRNKNFWINGQFDPSDGKLTVVDERSLEIAGRAQLIRTTGQYVCKKAGSPLTV